MRMKENFKIGDKVRRTQDWLDNRPGNPQVECIVSGLMRDGYLETDMGWRASETMEVVERDGIRIGDKIYVGEDGHLNLPWVVDCFLGLDVVCAKLLGQRCLFNQADVVKAWKVTSDERRMENAEPKDKEGHPEPFVVSGDGKVFIREENIGITHADVNRPAPAAQQYQDLVDALIRYNALVDRFPDAPKFKLVTL